MSALLVFGVYGLGYLVSAPFLLRPVMSVRTVRPRCHGEGNGYEWSCKHDCLRYCRKPNCWRSDPLVRSTKDAVFAALLAIVWPLAWVPLGVIGFILRAAPKTTDEREAALAAREAHIAELERRLGVAS